MHKSQVEVTTVVLLIACLTLFSYKITLHNCAVAVGFNCVASLSMQQRVGMGNTIVACHENNIITSLFSESLLFESFRHCYGIITSLFVTTFHESHALTRMVTAIGWILGSK